MAGAFPGLNLSSNGMAELMVIRLGFQMALQQNMGNMKVYDDAQGEVIKANCSVIPANEDGVFIRDIKSLCASLNIFNINYMSRDCNNVVTVLLSSL